MFEPRPHWLSEELVSRAKKLAHQCGLWRMKDAPMTREMIADYQTGDEAEDAIYANSDVVRGGDFGILEHLIHELSHAQSLGIPVCEDMSDRIGHMLTEYDDEDNIRIHCPKNALVEEARAWAIEWHVWKLLKLTDEHIEDRSAFSWGEVIDHAEIQGVEEDNILVFVGDDDIVEMATNIVEMLQDGS